MPSDVAASAPEHDAAVGERRAGSATRGFLFADLRGYTTFVEQRGAAAAAALLERYRTIVRTEIARFAGAEIRTEGDSFYVVFASVTAAVRAGMAITQAAASANAEAGDAIRVGVGVHAGETVETTEGYVGQPVNIAARLCAMAAPGEVLVTDTVRALTQSLLPVRFVSRGRRHLKGIREPIAIFAVETAAVGREWERPARLARGRTRLVALALVAVVAVGAVAWFVNRPGGLPPGRWTIGVSLPTTGNASDAVGPLHRAIELGLGEATDIVELADIELSLDVRDNGDPEFGEDPARSAEIAAAFAADPAVIAMIGPFQSFVAAEQIPITNEAGLLQCSPSATDPRLTKPRQGALDIRSANPARINFVRLAASADVEAAAGAWFAYNQLGSRTAMVVDDPEPVSRLVADAFEREFAEVGGTVVRRTLNPDADPVDLLAPLAEISGRAVVFFGGFTMSGAAEMRRAMVDAGYADVPFLGWDALWDGAGDEPGSFIDSAGEAAVGSYATHPSIGTVRADFERRYRDAYGEVPSAEYTGAAYACVEIILESLRQIAGANPSADELREALRAAVTDPERRFETVLGTLGFDENGDSTQQVVTFYRVDPSAGGGAGDWVVEQQRDFGPERDA